MKKLIVAILVVAILLVVAPAKAQTISAEDQYRQALRQLIALLIKQVEILTQQLATLRAEQNKAIGLPYSAPALPKGIEQATNKDITESGALRPSVILQARALRIINPNPGYFKAENIWDQSGEITIRQGEGQSAGTWIDDRLEILVNIGNPDKNFVPQFSCQKFGQWSGSVEPYDHWEEVKNPQEGNYGVKCSLSTGYTSEKSVTVKIAYLK